jgi:hypothetical protein
MSRGEWAEPADRLNDDIYKTSRATVLHWPFVADVVFLGDANPGPPEPMTAATRERDRPRLLEQNCLFRIETLPRNVGHLKLDGFMPPFACHETARRAMASLNNTDALILDLRDNHGGVGETALQIADYLFDRPAFLRPTSALASAVAHFADCRQQARRQAGVVLTPDGHSPRPSTSST